MADDTDGLHARIVELEQALEHYAAGVARDGIGDRYDIGRVARAALGRATSPAAETLYGKVLSGRALPDKDEERLDAFAAGLGKIDGS